MKGIRAFFLAALLVACGRPSPSPPNPASPTMPARPVATTAPSAPMEPAPVASAPIDAGPAQLDPDGDDDPVVDTGTGEIPAVAHFERVGRSPLALRHICDLTPFKDTLYAAHAYQPLGLDGATIVAYRPDDDPKKRFTTAFDWNRVGEKQQGGGAGQGFLRVHDFDGRLFVTDADPPYNGLGLVEHGTEGYVFISAREGSFAPARPPNHRPPGPPDAQDKAGAGVLPRAYHVLDAIRFRGRYYASTGSVPPKEHAWSGPSPGALHVASADLTRWMYEIDYPFPWKDGVWRLTYLVRFKDRLYAGIQDYDGVEPNDYVYFDPPADAKVIDREHEHPAKVTPLGTAQTLRWYADGGKLYWIASARDGVMLRVTEDGDHWKAIDLPAGLGSPTDITRFRGALVVMMERGLVKLDGTVIARVTDKKSPFALVDLYCGAPIAVYRNELYVGGQRDGALFKLAEGEAADAGAK
jgi:hypothetical protein